MKERGILFSDEMVRAILGNRKTQTRRVVKPQPVSNGISFDASLGDIVCHHDYLPPDCLVLPPHYDHPFLDHPEERCPYGVVGDRLWVREAWARINPGVIFRASDAEHNPGQKWKPGIHLRRVDARITLEITEVRVQRIHEISEEDARAEGVEPCPFTVNHSAYERQKGGCLCHLQEPNPRPLACSFFVLWRDINGDESWDANPWVWAISFKRVEATT